MGQPKESMQILGYLVPMVDIAIKRQRKSISNLLGRGLSCSSFDTAPAGRGKHVGPNPTIVAIVSLVPPYNHK